MNIFTQPWPWYIAGPLIGLMIPALLIFGNKPFGISSTLRHICAACIPTNAEFFKYDWKAQAWNLFFALGIILGGLIAGVLLANPNPIQLSEAAVMSMKDLSVESFSGLMPNDVFNWNALFTLRGFLLIVVGGFFVGFGTRYAGGCTSGHSIMGIANLQLPSLIATCCFFAGGLVMTWFILPYLMKL